MLIAEIGSPAQKMFWKELLLVESILAAMVWLPWTLLAYVVDWLHFRKLVNRFPGPPTRPIVGNLFDCGLFPKPWIVMKWIMEDVMYRYPAGQLIFGPFRMIVLSDVNDIQTFLKNSKNHSKPKLVVNGLVSSVGRGILTLNGKEWSQHHRIVKPSFHQNLLKDYVTVFNQKGDDFVEHLAEYANGCPFDVKHMTEALESVIVAETLFGIPTKNKRIKQYQDLLELVKGGQRELSHRLRRPWLYFQAFYNLTSAGRRAKAILKRGYGIMDEIVELRKEVLRAEATSSLMKGIVKTSGDTPHVGPTRKADADANKKQYNILIDALLQENGRSLSYENVLDELVIFFFAGFDTTAIALQFAFYYLAQNPLVQEKALRELQDIFGAEGSTEVTLDTLQRMQYVEMVVKETLRMHPPIFFILKEAGVDTPLLSSDLVVPAGATVTISPRSLHMDPKLYPAPHVFDPERFSPENSATRHPYAFIPFGAGMRACIGRRYAMMAMKTIISKVIWKYRIKEDESYVPELHWGISALCSNGMRIKLMKRTTF